MDYVEFQSKFNTQFRLRMSPEDIQILGQIEREFITANINFEPISDELEDRIVELYIKYQTIDEVVTNFNKVK